MPMAAVAMTAVVMVVMVAVPAAEAEAKARPVGVVAAVRIGIVVVWPVQPNQATVPMTAMPPTTADPHDILYSRVFLGDGFQAA
jgi:hypothetical protein